MIMRQNKNNNVSKDSPIPNLTVAALLLNYAIETFSGVQNSRVLEPLGSSI